MFFWGIPGERDSFVRAMEEKSLEKSPFDTLPSEIFLHILSFVPREDILKISWVSKEWEDFSYKILRQTPFVLKVKPKRKTTCETLNNLRNSRFLKGHPFLWFEEPFEDDLLTATKEQLSFFSGALKENSLRGLKIFLDKEKLIPPLEVLLDFFPYQTELEELKIITSSRVFKERIPYKDLPFLLSNLPESIEKFFFEGCGNIEESEDYSPFEKGSFQGLRKLRSLKLLSIHFMGGYKEEGLLFYNTDRVLQGLREEPFWGRLETLHLDIIPLCFSEDFLKTLKNLKTFKFSFPPHTPADLTYDILPFVFASLPETLKRFSVKGFGFFSTYPTQNLVPFDPLLFQGLKKFHQLEALSLKDLGGHREADKEVLYNVNKVIPSLIDAPFWKTLKTLKLKEKGFSKKTVIPVKFSELLTF